MSQENNEMLRWRPNCMATFGPKVLRRLIENPKLGGPLPPESDLSPQPNWTPPPILQLQQPVPNIGVLVAHAQEVQGQPVPEQQVPEPVNNQDHNGPVAHPPSPVNQNVPVPAHMVQGGQEPSRNQNPPARPIGLGESLTHVPAGSIRGLFSRRRSPPPESVVPIRRQRMDSSALVPDSTNNQSPVPNSAGLSPHSVHISPSPEGNIQFDDYQGSGQRPIGAAEASTSRNSRLSDQIQGKEGDKACSGERN